MSNYSSELEKLSEGSGSRSRVMKTISGISEVVYSNVSHSQVEYTMEQRGLLEKLKIDL